MKCLHSLVTNKMYKTMSSVHGLSDLTVSYCNQQEIVQLSKWKILNY